MSGRACTMAAALCILALAVTGCTSSKSKGSSSPPASGTSAAALTGSSSTPPASSPAAETITKAQASAALLTASEIGTGFSTAQFKPSTDALPCTPNEPPLEQQVPSTLEVGSAALATSRQAALSEDLRFYPDATTAEHVLTLAAKGLDCAQGRLNITGTPEAVSFGKQQDITSDVGADQALAVQATSKDYDIVLIGCRVDRALVLFSFLRTKTSNTATLPNPIAIATQGVTKIKAAH